MLCIPPGCDFIHLQPDPVHVYLKLTAHPTFQICQCSLTFAVGAAIPHAPSTEDCPLTDMVAGAMPEKHYAVIA